MSKGFQAVFILLVELLNIPRFSSSFPVKMDFYYHEPTLLKSKFIVFNLNKKCVKHWIILDEAVFREKLGLEGKYRPK